MRLVLTPLAAAVLAVALPAAARADTAADPLNDYLSSFTGVKNADLDLVSARATFDGTNYTLSSTSAGAIGGSTGSLFVWGINRGGGSARLVTGDPAFDSLVKFDAVAVFFPDGTGRVVTFSAGAPVIVPLSGAVTIAGSTITGVVPFSLLPTTGFAAGNYTFSVWSRLRVNPAMDGANSEVADFAPNARALTPGVPEPATWAMLIMGFGVVGGAMRRRAVRVAFIRM